MPLCVWGIWQPSNPRPRPEPRVLVAYVVVHMPLSSLWLCTLQRCTETDHSRQLPMQLPPLADSIYYKL